MEPMQVGPVHGRILAYLEAERIPFEVIEHPAAASAEQYHQVLGTRYEQQAKALLVKLAGSGFATVAVQAQKRVDLARIAQVAKSRNAQLASVEELRSVTGCGFGELPPMGSIFGHALFVDREFLNEERIYFNAGSLTRSITLNPNDLVDSEKATLF